MIPKPEVDVEKAANELKEYLDAKKFDLVDYSSWRMQAWPDPYDDKYPELKSFARQWNEAFKYVDSVFEEQGFPEQVIKEFEAATEMVADAVNADKGFWAKIREAVIPLYENSKAGENTGFRTSVANFDDWKERRWKFVKFFYYPESFQVKTTEGYAIKNIKTGEVRKRVLYEDGVITDKTYPPGFVIDVM